jgi:hypothetical protein
LDANGHPRAAIGPELMPRYQAMLDRLKQETSLAAPIAS